MIPMLGLLATLAFQSVSVTEGQGVLDVYGNDQKGAYDVAGKVVHIGGNDSRLTLRGLAKRIEVNGNGHRITLDDASVLLLGGNSNRLTAKGSIASLTLHGTSNQVATDGLIRVSVSGVGNVVRWKKGPNGKRPQRSVSGVDNRVVKV